MFANLLRIVFSEHLPLLEDWNLGEVKSILKNLNYQWANLNIEQLSD